MVTAAGAPASVMAATNAASPASPPTKLPDVHAYAITSGETARTSVTPRATSAGSEMCTAISSVAANGAYAMRVMCRLTSSGIHRHSSRSSAKSYGATTPIPDCCSGGAWSMAPVWGELRPMARRLLTIVRFDS